MNKKPISVGLIIILSALIWGAVMVWCAYELKGTQYKEKITHIITGGVLLHFVAVWTPLSLSFIKKRKKQNKG